MYYKCIFQREQYSFFLQMVLLTLFWISSQHQQGPRDRPYDSFIGFFTEINWIPGERGNCWGQFGGFWASPWPQSVIKDTLTLFNFIFRFPGNFWNLLILIHFLQNDNNLNIACWITVISTNITLLFIFAFFNPTAENLGVINHAGC